MTKFQAKRVLKLVEFLRALPRKNFYFGNWANTKTGSCKVGECGSTACVLGWAATMPAFKRLGLNLNITNYGSDEHPLYEAFVENVNTHSHAEDAGAEIFGKETIPYFLPGAYPHHLTSQRATPKKMATHLEKLVKSIYPELF